MTTNELLVLLDREQQTLADENNHSAAALMREAASVIRSLSVPEARVPGDEVAGNSFRIDTGPEEMFRRQNGGSVSVPPPKPPGSPRPPRPTR